MRDVEWLGGDANNVEKSHKEPLIIMGQAELDQSSAGEEKICRNDGNARASKENGLSIKELTEALGKLMGP